MDVLCTQLRAWVSRQGVLTLADLRDAAAAALGLCQVSASADSSPGPPEGTDSLASLLSWALQQASSTPGIQGLIEQELDAWLLLAEPGMPLPTAASHYHLPHLPLLEAVLLEAARTHLHAYHTTQDLICTHVPDFLEGTSSSSPSGTSAAASCPTHTSPVTAAAAVLTARQDLFLPERWLVMAPAAAGTDTPAGDHPAPLTTAEDTPTWQEHLQQQQEVINHADKEEEHKVQLEAAFPTMPMRYASADGAVAVHQAPEKGHLAPASPATHVRRTSSSGHSTLSTGSQGSSGSSSSSLDSLDLPLCSYGSCSSTASSSSSGEGGVYATVVLNLASPHKKAAAAANMAEEAAAPAAEAPRDGVPSPISSKTAGVEASGRAEAGKQHRELPVGALDALRAHYQQQHWWPAAQLLLAALVSAFTFHPENYRPLAGTDTPPVDGAAAVAAGEGYVEVSSECFWRCTPRSAAVAWLQLPQ